MSTPIYECPACGRRWAADRPRWRCDCGSHLNLAPGDGLSRGEIAAAEASLWRYAAALALNGPPRVSLGEGWTPLVSRDWQGAAVLFKLEIADADRVVQGPRQRGHDQSPDRGRGRADPRGFVRERRRLDRDLRGGGRHPVPHLCPGCGATRQAGADRRIRRRCPPDPRDPPVGDRGRPRRRRRQLLRQPQLAPLFYRGHQDARLRAMGAARLSRSRQHPGADRLRQ